MDTTQDGLEATEKKELVDALRKHKGNKRRAAAEIGISRGTLYRRLKTYNMQRLIRQPLELDDF